MYCGVEGEVKDWKGRKGKEGERREGKKRYEKYELLGDMNICYSFFCVNLVVYKFCCFILIN